MSEPTVYEEARRLGLRPYVAKSTRKSWATFLRVFEMYPGDYLVEIRDLNKKMCFLKPKTYNRMQETHNLLLQFSSELEEAEAFFTEMAESQGIDV